MAASANGPRVFNSAGSLVAEGCSFAKQGGRRRAGIKPAIMGSEAGGKAGIPGVLLHSGTITPFEESFQLRPR